MKAIADLPRVCCSNLGKRKRPRHPYIIAGREDKPLFLLRQFVERIRAKATTTPATALI